MNPPAGNWAEAIPSAVANSRRAARDVIASSIPMPVDIPSRVDNNGLWREAKISKRARTAQLVMINGKKIPNLR